jgi:predicted glycosyltransferase
MLKARCVYLNDNEHAAGNRISFLFADRIMVPEFLDLNKVRRQWARSEKIIQYPGVKEGVYLWDYRPSASIDTQKSQTNKKVIFLRPEPWTAQYYKGECNFIDELLLELKGRYNIVLLPRGDVQKEYYKQGKFSGITVSEKSISLPEIMENCGLFIGAGGTMTREAAVLGVPTISIYQDELLDVDRFLIEKGAMVHKKNLTAVDVLDFLKRARKNTPDTELMRKGKEAYDLISATLLNP